ncbi:ATP-dependent DNA helicase PIF1 [Leucoagaricus sp. SymC.cos]|nr:ATP-dependent DNA helicase PIF1 [Leucoagaricus sp. SymC.cos]
MKKLANPPGPEPEFIVNSDLEPKVELSPEQARVYERVKAGKNVFFTGSAGTGKSVLLREIIKLKRNLLYYPEAVAITASTGIAAINIGGVTLHSWAGIKLGGEPVERFVGKIRYQRLFEPVLKRWKEVQTLIIDEISMIDGALFDYLEEIARGLRKSSLPFGGIQQVRLIEIGNPLMTLPFLAFANMLNEMRCGEMQDSTIETFESLSRSVTYADGIEPAEMYPTRREVASANTWRLKRLPGESRIYEARDHKGVDYSGQPITEERMLDILDKLVVPKTLELKTGAQVMLIKVNLRQGVLVNGSIGQVVQFKTPREAIESKTRIAQVESNTGNNVRDGNSNDDLVTQEILEHDWKWPVVKFTNGETLAITPADFTVNNGDGETMMASRLQLPLILAWALSVHKSQGQTLERVRVDLRRTFEKGQAYVALSRATNMEHLQVLNFSKEKYAAPLSFDGISLTF